MATAKTEILTATEINALTGQVNIRPLTESELIQRELDIASALTQKAEEQAKATARASALAKLAELGLTQEEIAAL
jgi:hypothetical protein